jgi:putative nucleotidyltransferase with HDIG domain
VQPTTVIAEMDFPVLKDPEDLDRERREKAKTVPAVAVREDSASVAAYSRLSWLRERVRTLRSAAGADTLPESARGELVLLFRQRTLIALLLGRKSEEILDQAELLLQDVMQRGYVTAEVRDQLAAYPSVRIVDPLGAATIPSDQLLTADRVRELARARAVRLGLPYEALADVVLYCAVPNLSLNTADTEALRKQAMASVSPQTRMVRKGEKIIGGHEVITPEKLRVLQSYDYWKGVGGMAPNPVKRFLPTLGDVAVVLVLLGAFFAYLWFHRRALLSRPVDFWLVLIIEAAVLLLGGLLVRTLGLPHLLVPVAAVSIWLTLHFDVRLAVAGSLLPVFLIGLVADGGTYFIAVLGLGVVVSVLLTPSLRQRKHFYRILGAVAGVHLAMLGGLTLADGGRMADFVRDGIAAAANPLLATALVFFLLPVSEWGFRRSTDLSLLELTDLNRGLLKRLMMTAPGTYHHSLMVGALAEAAAEAVGANPLLARVIGYYHDIGKMAKPDYFEENRRHGRKNPREKLAPSMSRLILESHVREGAALGREDRLPREVLDGIREHHGRSLMTETFRRASRTDPKTKEDAYRYPGPIPTSRESALVLLANQIDSEARGLTDPSPSRIKGLVIQVVQRGLEEGDLDASGLSLNDLSQARSVFTSLLSAAFHGRASPGRRASDAS